MDTSVCVCLVSAGACWEDCGDFSAVKKISYAGVEQCLLAVLYNADLSGYPSLSWFAVFQCDCSCDCHQIGNQSKHL